MSRVPNPHAALPAKRRTGQRLPTDHLPTGYIRVGTEAVDGDMARVTARLLERLVATGRMSHEEATEQRARWCVREEVTA